MVAAGATRNEPGLPKLRSALECLIGSGYGFRSTHIEFCRVGVDRIEFAVNLSMNGQVFLMLPAPHRGYMPVQVSRNLLPGVEAFTQAV